MARRNFAIGNAQSQAGSGVLDVPSLAVFRYARIVELVANFREKWGVEPTAVAIPVVEHDGLLFPVEGLGDCRTSDNANVGGEYADFGGVVTAITSKGMDVILTMQPDLTFLGVESIQLRNILGSVSAPICIGNRFSREIAAAVLGTGLDIALEASDGLPGTVTAVAIDATDLWPLGGQSARVTATCFCRACTDYFEAAAPGLVAKFKTFPNPWSLLLSASSTGMGFISDFTPETSPDEIVGLSKQRRYSQQFGPVDDAELIENARILQRYVRARHDQTISALTDLLATALVDLNPRPSTILIIDGEGYGWTSGIWMSELDDRPGSAANPFDELWFNPTSDTAPVSAARYRNYMWRRGRYLASDFFQLCGSAVDSSQRAISGVSRWKQEELRGAIRERGHRVLGGALNAQSLLGIPPVTKDFENRASVGRVGFVGLAIDDNFMEKFISQLRIAPGQNEHKLGPSLPDGLMSKSPSPTAVGATEDD